ncbi:MAG: Ribonuclease HII [Parcubacteria group bacterium GW2011_GWA2_51_10]|nr:MAG: Ribonuclease HII [Parcubacteria group bacterium GW2011_GWA2_51_10]
MTPESRQKYFRMMQALSRDGLLSFSVAFASPLTIDERGITSAVAGAIAQALKKLKADPKECSIFLDGLLAAPQEYRRQHTIVGGDDILPLISLAAVAAKVSRDRLMVRLARLYPQYGFELHKGYGTDRHYAALREFGLCEAHRRTYCKNFKSAS